MSKQKIDWSGIGAEIAGGATAGALYLAALIILFGPMAQALSKLG